MSETAQQQHTNEVVAGTRFEFGKNWKEYSKGIDRERADVAVASVQDLIGLTSLKGKTFLDIGSGSGLFSLAAALLGAHVTSFDYDTDSVACTESLRSGADIDSKQWNVMQGSVLDDDFMAKLGTYDIVYSWGVLHHTGDMNHALENAAACVAAGGVFAIALYNDQGRKSRGWTRIKRRYQKLPPPLQRAYAVAVAAPFEAKMLLHHTLSGHPGEYKRSWTEYRNQRGMSRWHDWIDWVGGYPFEVAAADTVINRFVAEGFQLVHVTTVGGGLACNEFVFRRAAAVTTSMRPEATE